MIKIPNLFIVGAAKAGTTSLYDYLDSHPQVYMSPVKEPHFFSKDIRLHNFREQYRKATYLDIERFLNYRPFQKRHIAFFENKQQYESLFLERSQEIIVGEASTGYLYSVNAAEEIFKFNPDARIAIILRQPIDRTISHYMMDISSGKKRDNILETIKVDYESVNKGWGVTNLYVDLSKYKDQMSRYLNRFAKNKLLILDFQELKENPNALFQKLTSFLGIDYIPLNRNERSNQTMVARNAFSRFLRFFYVKYARRYNFFSKNTKKTMKAWLFKKANIQISEEVYDYLGEVLQEDIHYYESLFKSNNE